MDEEVQEEEGEVEGSLDRRVAVSSVFTGTGGFTGDDDVDDGGTED